MHNQLHRPWSADEDQRLIQMLQSGIKRSEIAEALGRGAEAIAHRRRILQKQGLCPTS